MESTAGIFTRKFARRVHVRRTPWNFLCIFTVEAWRRTGTITRLDLGAEPLSSCFANETIFSRASTDRGMILLQANHRSRMKDAYVTGNRRNAIEWSDATRNSRLVVTDAMIGNNVPQYGRSDIDDLLCDFRTTLMRIREHRTIEPARRSTHF